MGCLALLAAPPSPLFMSEYIVLAGGLKTHPYLIALVLFALTIVAAGFIRHLMPVLFAKAEHGVAVKTGEKLSVAHGAVIAHYVFAALIGLLLWTPGGFFAAAKIAEAFGK